MRTWVMILAMVISREPISEAFAQEPSPRTVYWERTMSCAICPTLVHYDTSFLGVCSTIRCTEVKRKPLRKGMFSRQIRTFVSPTVGHTLIKEVV